MVVTNSTFSLVDAIAAVMKAFKENGSKVEKNDYLARTTIDDSGVVTVITPGVTCNKTLAFKYLREQRLLTKQERAEAREVITYLQQKQIMDLLKGKVASQFATELTALLDNDTVPASRLGMLVYVASMYSTNKARDQVEERTNELRQVSKALGRVGDKVTIQFTMIESRYNQEHGYYSVFGTDQELNLVSFLTGKKELVKSGKITGKVKNAGENKWHGGAMVTALNYVKVAD